MLNGTAAPQYDASVEQFQAAIDAQVVLKY